MFTKSGPCNEQRRNGKQKSPGPGRASMTGNHETGKRKTPSLAVAIYVNALGPLADRTLNR